MYLFTTIHENAVQSSTLPTKSRASSSLLQPVGPNSVKRQFELEPEEGLKHNRNIFQLSFVKFSAFDSNKTTVTPTENCKD